MGGCDFFGNEETNDTQATLCLQSVANLKATVGVHWRSSKLGLKS